MEVPTQSIEIIQNDLSPGGLRTLQLHSYIQTTKRKRHIEDLVIGYSKDKAVEDLARAYLDECERIFTHSETIDLNKSQLSDKTSLESLSIDDQLKNDGKTSNYQESQLRGFIGSEGIAGKNYQTQDKALSWKYTEKISQLDRVQVGEVRKLAYKGLPVTQEIVFAYKYADYSVYGASARIEIAEEGRLHSATIILPADLLDFKYDSSKPIDIKDIWPVVLDKAGYSHIPNSEIQEKEIQEKFKKPYSLKWYFDSERSVWRLAYIIDNFPKRVDTEGRNDRDDKSLQGWGGMLRLPIFDYVIDAYDKHLIAEI